MSQPALAYGHPRIVEGADPPGISPLGIPAAFNLTTSRTWRIASSVGIQVPFAKPKGGTVSEPEEAS